MQFNSYILQAKSIYVGDQGMFPLVIFNLKLNFKAITAVQTKILYEILLDYSVSELINFLLGLIHIC